MLRVSAATLLLAMTVTSVARAEPFDDPYDLPEAPRPPTLPELTHQDFEATLESTLGVLTPRAGAVRTPECDECTARYAYVQRVGLEIPIGYRRFFVGTSYEAAFGGRQGSGEEKVVGGNLELYGRTVWATRTGLAFGGGLGIMLPTAAFDDGSPAASVAHSAASLRPWDTSFFTHGIVSIRPFVDVRDVVGRAVVHFRQGLEVVTEVSDISAHRLLAVSGLYIGYRFTQHLSGGVEAFETYTIDAPIDDRLRATFIVSPSIRVHLPYIQPAISGFTNIGPPLYGWSDRVIGVRIAVTLVYDTNKRSIERGTNGDANTL